MRYLFLLLTFLSISISKAQFVPTAMPDQEYDINLNGWIANGTINHVETDEVNNKVWMAGDFTSFKHRSYHVDWMDFDRNYPKRVLPNGYASFNKMVSDGNNGYFVVGDFFSIGDSLRDFVAHLDADYQPTAWNVTGWPNQSAFPISDIHVGLNNIYIFTNQRVYVVNKNTGEILNWNITVGSLGGSITSLVEIGNYLYLGGSFQNLTVQTEDISKVGLAQIDITSGNLTAWDAGLSTNGVVFCLEKENNQLFIGGDFTQILGQSRNHLVSTTITTNNLTLNNWNPNPNGLVNDLAISGNKVMVIGLFTTIAGQSRDRIAFMEKNGTNVTAFNPGGGMVPNGFSNRTKAVFHGPNVLFNFYATNVNVAGQNRNYIVAFDTTTMTLLDWNPNPQGYPKISSVYDRFYTMGYLFMNEIPANKIAVFDANSKQLIVSQPQIPVNNSISGLKVSDSKLIFVDNDYLKIYDLNSGVFLTSNSFGGTDMQLLDVNDNYLYLSRVAVNDYDSNGIEINGLRRISLLTFELDTLLRPILSMFSSSSFARNCIIKDSIIYFCGLFDKVNGSPRKGFAGINLNTFVLDSIDLNIQASDLLRMHLIDSLLYIQGDFTSVQNEQRQSLASFNINTWRLTNWHPDWGTLDPSSVNTATFKNNHVYIGSLAGNVFAFPIYDNQLSNFNFGNDASFISEFDNNNQHLLGVGAYIYNPEGFDHNNTFVEICETEHLDIVEIYLGESYTWHGTTYNQTGTYYLTQTNPTGCDSVYILNLNVTDKFYVEHYEATCDSFHWQQTNLTYNQSGYYRDTIYGYIDTIHTLHLTIYPTPQAITFDTIYSIETYSWHGEEYTATGTYTTTVPSTIMCDSLLTLNLVHIPFHYDTTTISTCFTTYAWPQNGETYNESGIYIDTVLTPTNDTIYVLNLSFDPLPIIELTDTLFSSFSTFDFNGTIINQSGLYFDTLLSFQGCDSIVSLNLTVIPPVFDTVQTSACENYFWNITNITYNESGLYQDTVNYPIGDTVHILDLTIESYPELFITDTLESSAGTYNFNGTLLSQVGTYIDTLAASVGCDTIVELTLELRPAFQDTIAVSNCGNYAWPISGLTYSTSGFYVDTIFGITVQDTIRVLDLTIIPNPQLSLTDTLESSIGTYNFNGTLLSQAGIYIDTIAASVGCDTIVELSLVLRPAFQDTIAISNCDSYTWSISGLTYTTSGIYTDTIFGITAQDTIRTLNLTMVPYPQLFVNDTLESLTGSYNFYGTFLTQPGIYGDTIPASIGCDTIVELTLVLRPAYQDTIAISSCSSYAWPISGLIYTSSGLYTDTIFGITVQDTIRVLDLTINNSSTSSITQTACGSFTWTQNNETCTISGTYSDTIQNTNGCDSIVTLNLTIIPIQTLVVSNYTMPATTGNCDGIAQLSFAGNGDFEADIDGGAITFTSSSDYQVEGLCAGIHELIVTDACGATNTSLLIIPSSTNYIFENAFPSEEIIDTVSITIEDCEIDYNSIDTAYIESITVNGTEISVIWNVVDDNGNHLIGSSYRLDNGDGAYFLQLNLYCPTKLNGNVFSIGETILFQGGSISQASIDEYVADFGINIYPNPTNDFIYLNFKSSSLIYELSDAQGRVLSKGLIANNGTISLQNFERGIYYISLNNGIKSVTKSVVKN